MLDQVEFNDVPRAVVSRLSEDFPAAEARVELYRHMVRARQMEERMIKATKSGHAFFWVGGPGEEAFNVPLGMQVRKGEGPQHDYLHMHYRGSAVMLAMGMPMLDAVRQLAMRRTDPFSMGRNFVGHFAKKEWNVVPVTSVVEIQYTMAAGTALMQKRAGHGGVSIVTGGDAGAAEGDFATCLIWASRPGNELPVLIVVTNNGWGISTPAKSQHGERHIADRARPFGIPAEVIDGNDPDACWQALCRALRYCRQRGRPYLIEAAVSRLYGHSSASGAEPVDEPDCIAIYRDRLLKAGVLNQSAAERIEQDARKEADAAVQKAVTEPMPQTGDLYRHAYAPSPVDAVYPEDYTGLPA